jgi:integrase
MKIAKGIRRQGTGYQIYARVKGEFVSKNFSGDTSIQVLREELKTLRANAQVGIVSEVEKALTFGGKVKAYEKAKAGMPTLIDRMHRIEWWRDRLGRQRTLDSVTSVEVRQHLEALRKSGKKPGTLNVYRTALMDFYTVFNGREGLNPARGVPKYHEEELPLDLPEPEVVRAAFGALRQLKKGPSKSQARLHVLFTTGWPSAVLKRLRPQDIHWRTSTVTTPGRKKGGGTRPRTVPVSPAAVTALEMFRDVNAWGAFSGSALHSLLHRACDKAGVRRFRVYDLRHRFITTVVENSADERGAAELALHTSPQQTWRYSRAAASTRAKSALDAAFPPAVTPPAPTPTMRLVKTPIKKGA